MTWEPGVSIRDWPLSHLPWLARGLTFTRTPFFDPVAIPVAAPSMALTKLHPKHPKWTECITRPLQVRASTTFMSTCSNVYMHSEHLSRGSRGYGPRTLFSGGLGNERLHYPDQLVAELRIQL
jgi:hypothetical protein